jgi:NAD-dependent SIR2 family protein deacetylase
MMLFCDSYHAARRADHLEGLFKALTCIRCEELMKRSRIFPCGNLLCADCAGQKSIRFVVQGV